MTPASYILHQLNILSTLSTDGAKSFYWGKVLPNVFVKSIFKNKKGEVVSVCAMTDLQDLYNHRYTP